MRKSYNRFLIDVQLAEEHNLSQSEIQRIRDERRKHGKESARKLTTALTSRKIRNITNRKEKERSIRDFISNKTDLRPGEYKKYDKEKGWVSNYS